MTELFSSFHMQIMDVDRIPTLVAALLLSVVVGMISGPLGGNANSFFWTLYDGFFGRIGDRMNKAQRGRGDLVFRGFLLSVVLIVCGFAMGQWAQGYTSVNSYADILIVSMCITSGSVWYMLLKLYFVLSQTGKTKGGYFGLSRSARVDLNSVDDFGIVREGLVYSAISFDKGLVAPAIWYLIGGLPFLMIYSAVSFMAWRFGKCGFGSGFGSVPLALEKLMGFVPSLFSGFILSASAALTPTAKVTKAILSWWQVKDRVAYEQGGLVLSAIAWPLEVSLGGPVRDLSGVMLKKAWIGPEGASAQVDYIHLKRAIIMNVIAHILFVLGLLSAYIYGSRVFG